MRTSDMPGGGPPARAGPYLHPATATVPATPYSRTRRSSSLIPQRVKAGDGLVSTVSTPHAGRLEGVSDRPEFEPSGLKPSLLQTIVNCDLQNCHLGDSCSCLLREARSWRG